MAHSCHRSLSLSFSHNPQGRSASVPALLSNNTNLHEFQGTMNEKQKDELLKHVVGAIGAIKAQFEVEVIKDYEIPPLVNTKTMQDIGFGVKLQLNTRYDYDEEMLTQWKNMLKADEWYISVKRNQLHVTFKVRFKED